MWGRGRRWWVVAALIAAAPGARAGEAERLEATGAALEAAAAWEREAVRGRDDEATLRAARLWALDEAGTRGEALLAQWLARSGRDERAPRVALERARLVARRMARRDSAGARRVAITLYEQIAHKFGPQDPALVVLALAEGGRLVPPDARPDERLVAHQLYWAAVYQWHLLPQALARREEVRDAAAGAAFALAEVSVGRALSPSLDEAIAEAGEVDAARLVRIVTDRLSWLETARPKLHKVADYGAPRWAMAAVVREAQLFHAFADMIEGLRGPADWTRAQRDAVRPGLAGKVAELREQAEERYAAALRYAVEREVTGPWSRAAAEGLARLRPEGYPLVVRRPAVVRLPDGLPGTGFVTRPGRR